MAIICVKPSSSGTASGADWTNAIGDPSSFTRGNTYYFSDGTYAAKVFNTATTGSTITIKKATVADHGPPGGWNNTFGDGVDSSGAVFGSMSFRSNDWVVDGQVGGGPGNWTSGFGFQINWSNATELLGCPLGFTASNLDIKHINCIGTRNTSGGGSSAQDGFASWGGNDNIHLSYLSFDQLGRCVYFMPDGDTNFVAEYIYNGVYTSTEAAHSEAAAVYGNPVAPVFRYSIWTHCEGTGMIISSGRQADQGVKVYGNIFYRDSSDATWRDANGIVGNWTGGVNCGNDTSNSTCEQYHNNECYNNTFVNCDTTDPGNALGTDNLSPITPSGNIARNNLFVNMSNIGGPTVWTTITHNHFSASSSVGTNTSTGTVNFVDVTTYNFTPTADTPSGFTLSSPYNVDMFGTTRTPGSWTRGAVQFGAGGGGGVVTPIAQGRKLQLI